MLPGLGSYCAVANMFESLGLSSSDPKKHPGRDDLTQGEGKLVSRGDGMRKREEFFWIML